LKEGRPERTLALVAAALFAAVVVMFSIPVYLKTLVLSLLILMVFGSIYNNEMVIEIGFSTMYLALVVYSAHSQVHTPAAFILALLSLATRDYLHIISKGKASGADYLVTWYLPPYLLSAVVLVYSPLLREVLPGLGAAPIALSVALAVLVISRFLHVKLERE